MLSGAGGAGGGGSALRDLFGGSGLFGGAGAESVFGANHTQTSRTNLQLSIKSLQRELNNLTGFKTDLTPAQRQKLSKIQADITKIEAKAGDAKGLTADDLEERAELYRESFSILGKDYVDKEQNPELQKLTDQVDKLLEPRLRGAPKKRLEQLRKIEDAALDAVVDSPESTTNRLQLRNIKRQIGELTQPRQIQELSPAERRDYDELVSKINDLAKTEFLLPSRKRIRTEKISASIAQLKAQEAAYGEEPAVPSPAQVVRAYTR